MEVYRLEESEKEDSVLHSGVTVKVKVEEVTVLQAGTQQGTASGVRSAKNSEFGEEEF